MVPQGRQLNSKRGQLRVPQQLRVLIDARKLGHGGIGVYVDNLIRGMLGLRHSLVRQSAVLEAVAVGDRPWTSPLPQEASRDRAAERLQLGVIVALGGAEKMPWRSQVEVIEDAAQPYSLGELFTLPRRLPWERYDIFHTPHYMLPYGIPVPSVVTLHDLIHLQTPQQWYYPWIAGALIRSALKRAARVICVSQATYSDVSQFTRDNPRVLRNVRVVSNAVDPFFLEDPLETGTVAAQPPKQPYFLSIISTAKPHKGLGDLLSAWERMIAQLDSRGAEQRPHLFIVGQGCEDAVPLQRLCESREVTFVGPVSKEELRLWYRYAEALVVPSTREGFGLPVIEAHASGTPVIVRPVPALLELVGEGDYTAADLSVGALASALTAAWECRGKRVVTREALRAETGARYDLMDVARATLQVYGEALEDAQR